ncbi:UU173 family protein [Mycoplasma sp. 2575]
MKNKVRYSFSDFLVANTTHPWLVFNSIDGNLDSSHEIFAGNFNFDLEDDNDSSVNHELINFYFDKIDNISNEFASKYLDKEKQDYIQELDTLEKIDFLKETVRNNHELINNTVDEDVYKNLNFLFSIFTTVNILSSGLDTVYDQAIDFLVDFYKERYHIKDEEIKYISLKQKQDDVLADTIKSINENYRLIINPAFEYQSCYAKVAFYDTKLKHFGDLIYSQKTNRKNLLKAYWNYNIITKSLNSDINEIFLLKPRYQKKKNVRKNILKFNLSKYCSPNKGGVDIKPNDKVLLSEDEVEAKYICDPNFAYTKSVRSKKTNNLSIIDHVKGELISAGYDFNEKRLANIEEHTKNISDYTCSFKEFIYLINNRDSLQMDWTLTKDDFIDNFNSNIFFYKLVEKQFPKYKFGSKKILKLISGLNNDVDLLTKRTVSEFYDNNLISINPEIQSIYEYNVITDKNANIAWFDFEGVTLPTPMLDYLPAWNQVISQTSIVKTQNDEIYESNDYVYDPLTFDINTYKKIIDDLYDQEISYYIIYNINYEKSRLLEIKESLHIYCLQNKLDEIQFNEYAKKIDFIVNRLVDICNFFSGRKQKIFVVDRMINLGYINGSYSIKKIEYFVTNNNLNKHLKYNITPYSKLNVKNGSEALTIATTRALNLIKDNEWNRKIKDLKIYCHNDVMAMLMAAELVKYLLKNKDEYFENFYKYNK